MLDPSYNELYKSFESFQIHLLIKVHQSLRKDLCTPPCFGFQKLSKLFERERNHRHFLYGWVHTTAAPRTAFEQNKFNRQINLKKRLNKLPWHMNTYVPT